MHVDSTAKIADLEQNIDELRRLTMAERAELLAAVCRDAAEIEASRARMGLPPVEPAPWPDSTWEFLASQATRVRERNQAT